MDYSGFRGLKIKIYTLPRTTGIGAIPWMTRAPAKESPVKNGQAVELAGEAGAVK